MKLCPRLANYRAEKNEEVQMVTTNIAAEDEKILSSQLDFCEIREYERDDATRKGFVCRKKKPKVSVFIAILLENLLIIAKTIF